MANRKRQTLPMESRRKPCSSRRRRTQDSMVWIRSFFCQLISMALEIIKSLTDLM